MTNEKKVKSSVCFFETPSKKFLLLKRHPSNHQGDRWGLVGGVVDPGESPIQAMTRETKEEIGLDFDNGSFEFNGNFELHYPDMVIDCATFKCCVKEEFVPILQQREALDFMWMSYKDAYNRSDLMEGLYQLLEKLNFVKAKNS